MRAGLAVGLLVLLAACTEAGTGALVPTDGGESSHDAAPRVDAGLFRDAGIADTGEQEPLLFVPGELDVGAITVGCATRRRVITAYNLDAPDLSIESVELRAPSAFTLDVSAPLPAPLQPGGTIDLWVTARPPGPERYSGTIDVRYRVGDRVRTRAIPLSVEGVAPSTQVDTFEQEVRAEVDVLLVIDDGVSMQTEQGDLRARIQSIAGTLAASYTDYHLAVTTTNMADTEGRLLPLGAAPEDRVFAFEVGAEDRVPVPPLPGATSPAPSQGLDAIYAALHPPLTRDVNRAFLRPDAVLDVILISDRDDTSTISPEALVEALATLKQGHANLVNLSAVVSDDPLGCSSAAGVAEYAPRYVEAGRLGRGVVVSICEADWQRAFEPPFGSSFGPRTRFFLTRNPVPETLRVFVNDVEVPGEPGPNGLPPWTYDFATNELRFFPTLASGTRVRAEYQPECL